MSYIQYEFPWRKGHADRGHGGINMVTVRRKKKRSMLSPVSRWREAALIAVAAASLALCVFGLAGPGRLAGEMDDLTAYMAKSVRADLNQAVQACDALGRRSGENADTLNGMKRCMYAAYRMNQLLVTARGESYSIIDTATYNNFQTIAGEYERLLANGQSTAAIKTSLGDYMAAISSTLVSRFDSRDALLPQTAARQPGH